MEKRAKRFADAHENYMGNGEQSKELEVHMLLNGTREHKKIYISIIVILLLLVIVFMTLAIKEWYYETRYPEPEEFTKKMYSMLTEEQHVELGEVFNFEFDKAFVQNGIFTDEEYYTEKMNLKTVIDIPTLWSEVEGRILFVKDNVIVYDYIYSLYGENAPDFEVGIWIYPDTQLSFNEEGKISIE